MPIIQMQKIFSACILLKMYSRKMRKVRNFLPLLLLCFFVLECAFFIVQLEMYNSQVTFNSLEMLRCGVYRENSRNLTLNAPCINCSEKSPCKTCTETLPCKNCANVSMCKMCSDNVIKHKILGPGSNGTGLNISHFKLSQEDMKKVKSGQDKHRFNAYLSDVISVHRQLPDMRHEECKRLRYPENLTAASIIIIFRDELLSVLLRTVYSILENTPEHLVLEIVLVDDGSVIDDLFAKLDMHVASISKVKVIRLSKSRGLMVARQTGIKMSRSDYFVVMDSHMEVNTGWLEPLIHRLTERPKALLTSKIGGIKADLMSVQHSSGFDRSSMMGINFNLGQLWLHYDEAYLKKHPNITEPMEAPAVQGMFIAMKKDFFLELGGFDTGMEIWGAEQMELSIKVWLCGGSVEKVPCSLVAHLFRQTPWSYNSTLVTKNRLRVGVVWLDNYKEAFFHTQKHRMVNYGDVDDRIKIRETIKCRPFQYFVDKVHEFNPTIYIPLNPLARGRMRNLAHGGCIFYNTKTLKTPELQRCSYAENQYFILSEMSDIRFKSNLCLVADKLDKETGNQEIRFTECTWVKDKNIMLWTSLSDMTLRNSKKCLTANVQNNAVHLQQCQNVTSQRWMWEW